MTYEEACRIAQETMRECCQCGEAPEEIPKQIDAALAPHGWSIQGMCDEARRRMHDRIFVRCTESRHARPPCLRDADHSAYDHSDWMPEPYSAQFQRGKPVDYREGEVMRMWARYKSQGFKPEPIDEG